MENIGLAILWSTPTAQKSVRCWTFWRGGPAEVLFEREILQRFIGEGEPIREKITKSNGRSNKKSNKLKTIFCRASSTAKAECYENLSPTLTAHNGVVAPFISSIPPRHLMPIECERIQGFPDNWTNVPGPNGKLLSNTRRYKMIGNSKAVPVMRWIGKRILMVENNANSKAKM